MENGGVVALKAGLLTVACARVGRMVCGTAGNGQGAGDSAGAAAALGDPGCGGIVGVAYLMGWIWRSSSLFLASTLRDSALTGGI